MHLEVLGELARLDHRRSPFLEARAISPMLLSGRLSDRLAFEHRLQQMSADLCQLDEPGDPLRDQLAPWTFGGLERLVAALERAARGANPPQLALAEHARHHLPDVGLGFT